MRVLLVENRFKTRFWECIAEKLQQDGHEIVWLVQNHAFRPRSGLGTSAIMPYPTGISESSTDPSLELIKSSDRNLNYFGGKDSGYFTYYQQQVRSFFEREKVDIAFGETTLFHELLVVEECRRREIVYLQPLTSRYPTGRFSFYRYNTLEPVVGSGEKLSHEDALDLIRRISNRAVKPDYMVAPARKERWKPIFSAALLTTSYAMGERYNTPAPWRKRALERSLSRAKEAWEQLAVTRGPQKSDLKVLYPLQMQPESNLDVFGNRWRNQNVLIDAIGKLLPPTAELWIKPNPKSKYEMNDGLVDVVSRNERIIPLPHAAMMSAVLPKADLVVTVTGTIAIECFLSGKPIVTLAQTFLNKYPGAPFVQDLGQIQSYMSDVARGTFPAATFEQKAAYLNELVGSSYAGLIGDPFTAPQVIEAQNIDKVVAGFRHVIESITLQDANTAWNTRNFQGKVVSR